MVVDEQQRLTAQLALQRQKIQDLTTSAKETHAKLALAEARAQEEEQKAIRLENELQTQTTKFHQNQETIMAKLTNEDSQNRQLRQKLAALSRQIDELEETKAPDGYYLDTAANKYYVVRNTTTGIYELRTDRLNPK